ncbi:DUF2523 family protein [Acinetobacter sp. MD2]|uniref:DUF2523 family protein n=1 Tax=Acinetobacter sp. MD2 TaxID=2600066 RepID=UPI002D1F43FF|nr:DUF2523 family protein [Acinetobacter sp. MD2]MEB3767720.1 DUF2523 domain-containing protein [Acinetobacter sp. MD2]
MINLATILKSTQKGFLKNVLEGAGVALGTTGVTLVALHQAINYFEQTANSIPSALMQLMGLSGFDIFFSLILGAMVAKHQANISKLVLRKK